MSGRTHGGKRKCAGRKPILTVEQRLWIGSEAAKKIVEATSSLLELAFAQGILPPSLVERFRELDGIKITERAKWKRIGSEYGFDADEDDTKITELISDIRDSVRGTGRVAITDGDRSIEPNECRATAASLTPAKSRGGPIEQLPRKATQLRQAAPRSMHCAMQAGATSLSLGGRSPGFSVRVPRPKLHPRYFLRGTA